MTESAKTLADPYMEELSLTAKVGNTDLIMSNIYVPPASTCTRGYIPSIHHLPKTTCTLIPGYFTTLTIHNSS